MPTCRECGEADFEKLDGLFYCTYCQTQSQDVQEEEEEEYAGAVIGASQQISTPAAVRPPKEKEKVDKGRPWMTSEAFQLIIHAQVKALIMLGAPVQLEDVVFRLWTLYLSKTGDAFTEKTISKKIHKRTRDKYPATKENPVVRPIRLWKTLKKKHGVAPSTTGVDETDPLVMKLSLQGEEFYEGDDPSQREAADMSWEESDTTSVAELDDGDDDVEDDDDDDQDEEEFTKFDSKRDSKSADRTKVERMNMCLTICFCYLGLLYTKCYVVIADIRKWIREDKFPFMNVSKLFPKDMKFSGGALDMETFRFRGIPTVKTLLGWMYKLVWFLEVDNISSVSLNHLVSRYIVQLNLPSELHGMTRRLFESVPDEIKIGRSHSIPHCEVRAAACIVITLKLLFGLDDHTEKELSEYARELSKLLSLKQPLFIYEDWIEHTIQKMDMHTEQLLQQHDFHQLNDVSGYMKQFNAMMEGKEFSSGKTYRENKNFRDSCRKTFETVHLKVQRTLSDSQSDSRTITAEGSHSCTKTALNTDFCKSSLRYITQGVDFLEDVDNLGLSDFTMSSSQTSDSDSDDRHRESDEEKEESTKKKKRKKLRKVLRAAAVGRKAAKRHVSYENVSELFKKLIRAYETYALLNKGNLQDAYSYCSYRCLLSVISHLVECNVEDLALEVEKFELMYITAFEHMNRKQKYALANLQKRYGKK